MPDAGALRLLQARILSRARLAPAPGAIALVIARQCCGSMRAALAEGLARNVSGFELHDGMLELVEVAADPAARSQRLDAAARWLLQAGEVSAWRNEALEVRPAPHAAALACIDRSAVRVLGITTYSVHLNGYTADGRIVVARRAAHKRVDPGLWDNLAGGMIAAGEDPPTALGREAHEEAGIRVGEHAVREGTRFSVRRPIAEGVLAEVVHVYDIDLRPEARVQNIDGEVAEFAIRTPDEICAAIERGEFTVEAGLATIESLLRRGG